VTDITCIGIYSPGRLLSVGVTRKIGKCPRFAVCETSDIPLPLVMSWEDDRADDSDSGSDSYEDDDEDLGYQKYDVDQLSPVEHLACQLLLEQQQAYETRSVFDPEPTIGQLFLERVGTSSRGLGSSMK
jgi:hypothetical protein